ncbi:hypothetical protein [Actinomadura sp. WAC 06369]|uniref:hypothetical protein n=1 Tax=Actinomadura sp. WAC 06369 TaxID=2203193 RepID=UPI000F7745FC|nr:hypothetical protein [Actinomadura sp. WAC 06369]RSN62025.1 hypothetical protein DMH08_19990 [Actinomadura sp. WAC 06369]
MLLPGLTLHIASDLFTPADLTISPGVRPLPDAPGAPAEGAARTARPGRRPLTARESALLRPDAAAPGAAPHERLTVFDVGAATLDACRAEVLPLLAGDDRDALAAAVRTARDRAVDALVRRTGYACDRVRTADAVVHAPGRLSTAFNFDERVYMGLHLDDQQGYPLDERDRSFLLASVNIGFRERYLHFVNLRVPGLIAMVENAGRPVPETARALKDAFFDACPDYPVIRVKLRPGQAYLLNTQGVLHDGATNQRGMPDVSLLMSNDLSAAVR